MRILLGSTQSVAIKIKQNNPCRMLITVLGIKTALQQMVLFTINVISISVELAGFEACNFVSRYCMSYSLHFVH